MKRQNSACSVSLSIGGSQGMGRQNRKRQTDKKTMRRQNSLHCFTGTGEKKEKTKNRKAQKDNEKTKTVCSVSLTRVSQGLGKKRKRQKIGKNKK